jgi:hypothetical protein
MNATSTRFLSRGQIVGTLLACGAGLGGSWAADALVANVDGELAHTFAVVAAGFVIGGVGGAFGRGLVGLLALWVGVIGAGLLGYGLEPPEIDLVILVNPVVVALAVTGFSYIIGRVVDPIWDGRSK